MLQNNGEVRNTKIGPCATRALRLKNMALKVVKMGT
jgi:hypothetical protein